MVVKIEILFLLIDSLPSVKQCAMTPQPGYDMCQLMNLNTTEHCHIRNTESTIANIKDVCKSELYSHGPLRNTNSRKRLKTIVCLQTTIIIKYGETIVW